MARAMHGGGRAPLDQVQERHLRTVAIGMRKRADVGEGRFRQAGAVERDEQMREHG